ncbi:MAG: hypothetical protein ACKOEK_04105 [Actinomycetota bacterium]
MHLAKVLVRRALEQATS